MENSRLIASIQGLDMYREELEKIKVWVCSSACGKSYLSDIDDRFFDLDAYKSKLHHSNVENYEERSIDKMWELLEQGKIVLNASHDYFVNYLEKNNIPYVFMYGKPEVEEEYIKRMRNRGSGEEFVKRFGHLVSGLYAGRNKSNYGSFRIEMNRNEFVSDYVWNIFGTPKKFIQFNEFPKNKYKIAFVDIDGTLINRNEELMDFTIKALNSLKDKIKIVLISARGFLRIEPYLSTLGFLDNHNYTVAYNGGLILNNDENVLVENYIKSESIYLLKEYFDKNNLTDCWIYTYDKRLKLNEVKDLDKFLLENKVYEVLYLNLEDPSQVAKIRYGLPQEICDCFEISSSHETRLEFMNKGATKEKAIQVLINRLNIAKAEIIAIGDGENDIGMFELAGCSIAMCNAKQCVKDCADYITDSNNDDGVAKALIKVCG